jgi:hypothetical protein
LGFGFALPNPISYAETKIGRNRIPATTHPLASRAISVDRTRASRWVRLGAPLPCGASCPPWRATCRRRRKHEPRSRFRPGACPRPVRRTVILALYC